MCILYKFFILLKIFTIYFKNHNTQYDLNLKFQNHSRKFNKTTIA